MTAPHRLETVDFNVQMDKIHQYAEVVDDFNPIHVDPEFAAQSPMGGVIAHGTMSLALIWQSLRATFDADRVAAAELHIRFVKPVRVDDTLTAGGELMGEDSVDDIHGGEAKTGERYSVWVRNQAGDNVISGVARI